MNDIGAKIIDAKKNVLSFFTRAKWRPPGTIGRESSYRHSPLNDVQTLFEVRFGVSWAANPAFLDAFHTKCAQNIHETSKDRSKSPASSRAAVDVSRWLLDESGGLCLASITRRAWRSAWQRSFKTSPAWFARLSEYVAVAHRLPPGRVTGHLHLESRSFLLRTRLRRARPTR